MKYLTLPISLLQFWYPGSVSFFIRTWKNLMLFLEEDLAVGLMWKLLFTPLFHDSSIVGRFLSFFFRLSRILIGLFAFLFATVVLFAIAGYWLVLPALAVFDIPYALSRALFLGGMGLFFLDIVSSPHKKIWQVGKSIDDFWKTSMIKREDLSFKKLLESREVGELLSNLEVELSDFPAFEIADVKVVAGKAYELGKLCGSEYLRPTHFFVAALSEMPNIDTNLAMVGVDLTREAASKGFADLVRDNGVLKEIINILSQEGGRSVILVGPPGSGKTATLRYLAKQIVTGDAPEALATKRIVLLDLTKLLSGIKTQGDLAERVKAIFEEVGLAQNIIIVIEEIHELGMGEVGTSLNLYSLMQPYLESDSFQFIGTTEAENYSRILEKNSSFARLFRKVELSPATEDDTLKILEDRAIEAERKSKVKMTFVAIKTAVALSQKLIHDRVLPDSAISVLKEALTQPLNGWVTKEVIRRVISARVKVPLMEVDNTDKNKLLNLEDEIHQRLIDQEQAVKTVADALRRSATGLREEARPIGSFLFVGPTGVGKTELAKTLSEVYFKN